MSSFGELTVRDNLLFYRKYYNCFFLVIIQYCLSNEPEVRLFDPEKTCLQEYPITSYQPVYFLADSFKDAKDKMRFSFSVQFIPF